MLLWPGGWEWRGGRGEGCPVPGVQAGGPETRPQLPSCGESCGPAAQRVAPYCWSRPLLPAAALSAPAALTRPGTRPLPAPGLPPRPPVHLSTARRCWRPAAGLRDQCMQPPGHHYITPGPAGTQATLQHTLLTYIPHSPRPPPAPGRRPPKHLITSNTCSATTTCPERPTCSVPSPSFQI